MRENQRLTSTLQGKSGTTCGFISPDLTSFMRPSGESVLYTHTTLLFLGKVHGVSQLLPISGHSQQLYCMYTYVKSDLQMMSYL